MEANATLSNSSSEDDGNGDDYDNPFISKLTELTGVPITGYAFSLGGRNLTVLSQQQRDSSFGSSENSARSTAQSPSNSQDFSENEVIDLVSDDEEEETCTPLGTHANLTSLTQQASAESSLCSNDNSPPLPEIVQQRPPNGPLELDLPAASFPIGQEGMSPQNSDVMPPQVFEAEMDMQGQNDVTAAIPDEFSITAIKNEMHRAREYGGGISRCECGSKFTSKVAQKYHLNYYNSEWKFKCDKCTKKLYTLSILKVHLKKEHGVKHPLREYLAGCTLCGIGFRSRTEFVKHRKREHNIHKEHEHVPVVGFLRRNPFMQGRYPRRSPRQSRVTPGQSGLLTTTPMVKPPPDEVTLLGTQNSDQTDLINLVSDDEDEEQQIGSPLPSNSNSPPPQLMDHDEQQDNQDNDLMNHNTTDNPSENANYFAEISAELNAHSPRPDYGESYGCQMCPQAFRDLAQLKRHLLQAHQSICKVVSVKCGVCGMEFGSCKSFHAHRDRDHNHNLVSNSNHQNDIPECMSHEDSSPICHNQNNVADEEVAPLTIIRQDSDQNQNELNANGRDVEEESEMEADAPSTPPPIANVEQPIDVMNGNGREKEMNGMTTPLQNDKRGKERGLKKKVHATEDGYYWCTCGSKFKSKVLQKRHIKYSNVRKKFKCEKCERKFLFLTELKRHLKMQHKIKKPLKNYAVGCSTCGIMIKTWTEFYKHKITEHKNTRKVPKPRRPCIKPRQ